MGDGGYRGQGPLVVSVNIDAAHILRECCRTLNEIRVAGADKCIRPGRAACSYSWMMPPRRSRRRTARRAVVSGSLIGRVPWSRRLHVSAVSSFPDAVVAIGDYAVGNGAEAMNRHRLVVTQEPAASVQRVRMHAPAAIDLAWLAAGHVDAMTTPGELAMGHGRGSRDRRRS
jgi:hypothetical protein